MKKYIITLLLAAIICAPFSLSAQVTIGSSAEPREFSVLELVNDNMQGLRLPQMTMTERIALQNSQEFQDEKTTRARGLMIFNTSNRCVETWDGGGWISQCVSRVPYLSAPAAILFFSEATSNRPATVTTNVPAGWEVVSINQGGISPVWLSTTPSAPSAAQTGNTLLVSVTANGVAENRVGTITLQAVGTSLTHTINVTQLGTGGLGSPLDFVGAFWRYDQFGERLIRMTSTNNAWTATATEPWIVLCDTMPAHPAPNVPFGTDTPPVLNGRSYVTGSTSAINFRIGLVDDGNAPANGTTAAPRYGQVIVTHNNNAATHIIWVRQGEAADYVMRPTDLMTVAGTTITNEPRPAARRISPFNLTAPANQWDTNLWVNATNHSRGVHTNYPSQNGAFWMWASSNHQRRPYSPVRSTLLSGWGTAINTVAWDTLADVHEACPVGYRRPTDGRTDTEINSRENLNADRMRLSEMRQSLFLVPVNGIGSNTSNSVFGFYADGFFDRRVRNTATQVNNTSATNNTTVELGTTNVASRGTVFFNPITNAHVFLPAAGSRGSTNGSLSFVGTRGFYWSSTTSTGTGVTIYLQVNQDESFVSHDLRSSGNSVRCVRE